MPKTTKSGFGTGHSLTLCKAAANARLQKVHRKRMKRVGPSIDVSVPHSLHRNFDNSKGRLQKKREQHYQDHADKVTSERIKKMNARCPIAGETLHDKIAGGSMHSPPKRAFEVLMRNNKHRKKRFQHAQNRLDQKNKIIARRLKKVPPSSISRRSGTAGWDHHWKKHEHWQNTNIKRRLLMQKLVEGRLDSDSTSTRVNPASPVKRPPPPMTEPLLQPLPPPPLSPILLKNTGNKSGNKSSVGLNKIVNPRTMVQPGYQEYINRMGIAEKTVFSPQAPPRQLLRPMPLTMPLTMPMGKLGPTTQPKQPESGAAIPTKPQHPRKPTKTGFKRKGRKRTRQLKKHMPARTMTWSEERLAKLDQAWEKRTRVNRDDANLANWTTPENVTKEMIALDCVKVDRWHDGVLEATHDPYLATDGPGWMCDVCSTPGTGLVYHDRKKDVDVCFKCINMARRLNWVEVTSVEKEEKRLQQQAQWQLQLLQQQQQRTGKKPLRLELDNSDESTWRAFKPNQPNSPIQLTSPTATKEEMDQRDQPIYRCGLRKGKQDLLLTLFASPDGYLLSDDSNGSMLVDVHNLTTDTTKRSVLTFTNIVNHSSIGLDGLLHITSTAPETSSVSALEKSKTIARSLVKQLVVDPSTNVVSLAFSGGTIDIKTQLTEQQKAATKLQAQIRGKNARRDSMEQQQAATKLQAQMRGKKTRRDSVKQQQAATKLQAHVRGSQTKKRAKKNMIFPGEVGKVFYQKGIYFENVRMFGLVKVEIIDGLGQSAKLESKREEIKRKNAKYNTSTSTSAIRAASTKPLRQQKRMASSTKKRDALRKSQRKVGTTSSNNKTNEDRQLLFTIYDPITSITRHIKVKKGDLETLFKDASMGMDVEDAVNDGAATATLPNENDVGEVVSSADIVQSIVKEPMARCNQKYMMLLIDMIHLEFRSLGFGGSSKMRAYMSKVKPPASTMEEEKAATVVQKQWRYLVARRRVHEIKMIVPQIHELLNIMHERGELATQGLIMDMKHTRVELLERILFQEEWRDAYEIACCSNLHVKSHAKFLKKFRKQLLVPRVSMMMFDLLLQKDELLQQDDTPVTEEGDIIDGTGDSITRTSTASSKKSNNNNETLGSTASANPPNNNKKNKNSVFIASDAEKRAACRAIFHQVDTDMSGYIDAEELVQLLTKLMNDMNLQSSKHEITIEEAEYFIDSMDSDGNSLIDCDEFVDFMVVGMSASDDAKIAFRDRSSLHEKLSILINGLSDITERRSKALQQMYEKYEDQTAGGLTTDSLFQLFSEAHTDGVHRYDDVQSFFQVMDEDRNGAISRDEWCSYLLYGMSMTNEWRENFSQKSPMHNKISAIVTMCLENTEGVDEPIKTSILKSVMM